MTDQRARAMASDMMTATSLVSKINNQRNRIAGGYDIPTDEPGPINIVAQALADERRRVWEEAAKIARNIPEGWEFQRVERAMIQSVLDDISDSIQAHAGQEG